MKLDERWLAVARFLVLAMGLAVLSGGTAGAQQAASGARFEGILSIVWADPRRGSGGGDMRFSLTDADGTQYALRTNAAQQSEALGMFGKRVVVQGRMSRSGAGAASIGVDRIALGVQDKAVARAPVVRRVLYILLKFKGDAQEPHPPSFFRALTNPVLPPAGSGVVATLNGYFGKTSYGKLKWSADVVGLGGLNPTNWLTLPKTKAGYAPCGWSGVCADLTGIQNDGVALAVSAGANLALYDNINFVLNNDLDCCAWGGNIVVSGKSYGSTWEPPWGQEAGIYVHELGHSIGLPHSGWTYYAYDSPWDDMSDGSAANSVQCGTYFSANDLATDAINCTEPGAGYITAHKDHLGWIPAANEVVINTASTRTVLLEANALPLGTGIKIIKVCLPSAPCTGASAHYLTVESRIRVSKFEKGLTGEGVIIHDFRANRGAIGVGNPCFFNSQSGWAVPIDATKRDYIGAPTCSSGGRVWPNFGLGNAQFVPGSVYSNPLRKITINVIRKSGANYVVKVTRAP